MENILPGTSTEEGASQHLQRLQTGGADVSPDEVPGEAGPVTSLVSSSLDPLQFAYQLHCATVPAPTWTDREAL